jgi:hypothetical protein
MTRVGCAPDGTPFPAGMDVTFELYGRPKPGVGGVGAALAERVAKQRLKPSARAWDFLSITLAVVAADESCARSSSPDGWTRQIELTIAVIDPPLWLANVAVLEEALRFLTGDIWSVNFIGGGFQPVPLKPGKVQTRSEDLVCLLSGGMDSLIGAIDLVTDGKKPLLVSQVAKGDKKQQRAFARIIAPGSHLQMNHNASPAGQSERSQRARSIGFFGFGVLAATCLTGYSAAQSVELVVPENGFISLNVPLTPVRLGSLSTRTTHPFYLDRMQRLLDATGLKVKLDNPYQLKTKGEMLRGCRNQALLKSLVPKSTSCGRYARTAFTQCGRCVPCLVRRASFQHWGVADPTPTYKYDALGTPGPKHRDFDDVRAVAFAAHTVRRHGLDAWIGGALNSVQLGQTAPLRALAQRGLSELEQFLMTQGAL